MKSPRLVAILITVVVFLASPLRADVGDPQLSTDHPWYPGELACSTFERLFATQAKVYQLVVGVAPVTDQDKALASWLWRNTHYWHAEDGAEDLWGQGFTGGQDLRSREYWTGLFAHGFGLCGTTHAQWVAEMEALFGHSRGRVVGVEGHNSFEVFLTGGPYGQGKWALLDHDISTVIFDETGTSLLSIPEIAAGWKKLTTRTFQPAKQHGWLVCGLHPDDGGVYKRYAVAEYLAGYSGPPPMVHLRRGETLRRYLRPGLDDGKTFVFWGVNYNTAGIPGPERAHTWVNQPEKMHGSRTGAGYKPGQARYDNAVYTYRPDFDTGDYKEGIVENGTPVVYGFYSPYIIAATPLSKKPWGVYEPGCKNGLIVNGKGGCAVSVSVDQGKTWQACGKMNGTLDLTDHVKGRRQYFLRFDAWAAELAESGLTMTTVCQTNSSVIPHLQDNGSEVRFLASGKAIVSAGPNLPQARAHVVAGKMGTPRVTLEIAAPWKKSVATIYAAAHVQSSSPPLPEVNYQIDYSADLGKTWKPVVKSWTVKRQGQEPRDFWSQSMCWGSTDIKDMTTQSVQVRFRNNGGKSYARCEAHLVYRTARADQTKVTFAWKDSSGEHRAEHVFPATKNGKEATWQIPTGKNVETKWVEMAPAGFEIPE